MNRLGVIVDISHVSDKTFYDAIEVSQAPDEIGAQPRPRFAETDALRSPGTDAEKHGRARPQGDGERPAHRGQLRAFQRAGPGERPVEVPQRADVRRRGRWIEGMDLQARGRQTDGVQATTGDLEHVATRGEERPHPLPDDVAEEQGDRVRVERGAAAHRPPGKASEASPGMRRGASRRARTSVSAYVTIPTAIEPTGRASRTPPRSSSR